MTNKRRHILKYEHNLHNFNGFRHINKEKD